MNWIPVVKLQLTQGQAYLGVEAIRNYRHGLRIALDASGFVPGTPLYIAEDMKIQELMKMEKQIQKAMQK